MFDTIKWILDINTNTLIFNFVMNNVLAISLVMVTAKVLAKFTSTSKDDTIVGLIDGWLDEVKGLGRGVGKVTVQAARATGGAVKKVATYKRGSDPTRAAEDH